MPKRSYVDSDYGGDATRRRRLNGNSSSSQSQSRRSTQSTPYVPQSTTTNRSSSSSQTSSGRRQLPWLSTPGTQRSQSRQISQSRPSTQKTTSAHTAHSSQSTQPTSNSYAIPSSQHRPPAHVQAIRDTLNWLSTQPDILESDDEPEVIDLTQADPGPVLEFYGHFGPYTSLFRFLPAPRANTRQTARLLVCDTTTA